MEGASEGWWSPGDEVQSAPGPSTPLPGAQAASLRSNPSWGLSNGASSSDSLSDAITFHSALEQVRSDTRWHMPPMMAACIRAQGRGAHRSSATCPSKSTAVEIWVSKWRFCYLQAGPDWAENGLGGESDEQGAEEGPRPDLINQ